MFFNQKEANSTESLQNIAKEVAPLLASHEDDVKLNKKLFERIKYVYDNEKNENLTVEQQTVTKKYYEEFIRAGADLDVVQQNELRKINPKLSLLYLKFGENVLADTNKFKLYIENKEDLSGLSQEIVDAAAEAANEEDHPGEWLFTLNKSSMLPFLQYADNRELRKKIMIAYMNVANNSNENDNKKIISEIVELRTQKAHILGYSSYADYAIADKMANTLQNAYDMTMDVYKPSLEKAKQERDELQEMIYKNGDDFKLQPWDWAYYAAKLNKGKYDIDENEMSQYFDLNKVLKQGLFYCAFRLYRLRFQEIDNIPKPNPDTRTYRVTTTNDKTVGILYMDLYTRENKQSGAWADEYVREENIDKKVLPVVTIVCNFPKPTKNTPSLLTLDQVRIIFHEFGHALQALLSECNYPKVSGLSGSSDYVEFPSQFMENWKFEPQVLSHYAYNYKTGENMSLDDMVKLQNYSKVNQGFVNTEILSAALLDLAFHSRKTEEPIIDINKFEADTLKDIGLISEIPPRYRPTYFNHIFSSDEYAAGYYSYNWAQVLALDAFESFKESGDIFNKDEADSFKENILEKGDSGNVMDFYKNFRGKEPTSEAYLKSRGLQ